MEGKMNYPRLSHASTQMKGRVKSKWASLIDFNLTNLRAKKEMLVGKIQERYKTLKDNTERQLDDILEAKQRAAERPGQVERVETRET
jgi:uncharacterized protein YjbJ (UPF0337 family)